MNFFITLPSNVETPHYQNKQSNYTTPLDTPIIFNIPYEVALVEFAYREFIEIDIGTIFFKYTTNDKNFRPMKIKAYENEPKDHFIDRINYEIANYYSKLGFLTAKDINLDDSKYINDFEKRFSNNYNSIINSDLQKYQESCNKVKSTCPQFEINSKNQIYCQVVKDTIIKFQGYCTELFQVNEKDIKESFSFIYLSEKLNFFDYLMVYCDLVEHQYVGDSYSQLLRTICKTGELQQKKYLQIHIIFL